jgi:hypothetical protein
VTRVKLLLIERKELIIEERKIMDIRASLENNGTHMTEKMVQEEVEDYPREAMEKETGVMLETKLKAKLSQQKVKKVKLFNPKKKK